MPTTEPVSTAPRLDIADGVAIITLNRPRQRNRLEDGDLRVLLAYFDQLDADASVRVLAITANTEGQARPVFSAGYHLGGFADQSSDPDFFERIPDALARLRPITVCALNGSVYGGATDLLMACDIGIALAGSELRMPAAAIGLHYYPSGLQRYLARIGQSLTLRAFLTAQPLPVETLAQTGLLAAVHSAPAWAAGLGQLLGQIRDLAPLAAQLTKRSIREIAAGHCDLAAIRQRQDLTAASADFLEGRRAFSEKRQPIFVGR